MMGEPRDRAWLEAHLPHRGRMNLLEAILEWDATTVRAIARSHRDPGNPLRRAGMLPIACGIEYGAQAAAAHGALVSNLARGALASTQASPAGFLASVRSVAFHAPRLDDAPGDLEVLAEQIGGGAAGVLYRFEIACGGRALAEGRLAVAFAQ
jgi:predicted hotdog family 3-hydroxylacyl-ACP dehydratase